ncbi:hypothetical protein PHYSODRAFT_530463 [Phytophthora sojae]|uniref:SWIM-type domain-containing protein n=1 Tax=Phytophthora sojae (strain P6497) TaxID=1094619 RepID=G5AC03_PHYSP|nr:hypothetical protein PHYSODRAFT_530463 [Phytophthora sojae]EGZ06878.1 hypothetical protein PHYSODRAFT_530463 [Phytophthora sojae]|eukprot:XP_009537642.1 hypothetical protein PHYSODRAFT_530463 [Phytophthora sojae]
MGMLINVLAECCADMSHQPKPFRMQPEATTPLVRRAKQLASDKLLQLNKQPTGSPNPAHVRVQSRPAPRFYIPSKKRTVEYVAVTAQMGGNYARMEYHGQPDEGWLVDTATGWCQSRYWKKFGSCIHLLHARFASHRVSAQGWRILVNRNIIRKAGENQNVAANASAGRPPLNGAALSLT